MAQGDPCSSTGHEPEKVTSTCPQSFAELDPDCFGRVLGAGESFYQRWRRGLPAEPDLASAPSANIAARVHSESERLSRDVPDDRDVWDGHTISVLWGHSVSITVALRK